MTIVLQIIAWLVLMYFSGKLTDYIDLKLPSSPYARISNLLFDKGVKGVTNDIISGLLTFILFWLTVIVGLLYVVLSWFLIDWGFNFLGLG
jgi:hypothetical protein